MTPSRARTTTRCGMAVMVRQMAVRPLAASAGAGEAGERRRGRRLRISGQWVQISGDVPGRRTHEAETAEPAVPAETHDGNERGKHERAHDAGRDDRGVRRAGGADARPCRAARAAADRGAGARARRRDQPGGLEDPRGARDGGAPDDAADPRLGRLRRRRGGRLRRHHARARRRGLRHALVPAPRGRLRRVRHGAVPPVRP